MEDDLYDRTLDFIYQFNLLDEGQQKRAKYLMKDISESNKEGIFNEISNVYHFDDMTESIFLEYKKVNGRILFTHIV